jgi:NitT/TauT family transport system permease protein
VGLALIGAVLTEFFAGVTSGLGYAVKKAQSFNLTLQLWGSIFVLAFLGAAGTFLIGVLERVVLRWHSSQDTRA